MSQLRTIVYVDGFNLYYGSLRGSPNKWLDLSKFFQRLRPDDGLIAIKYFTAPVVGDAESRQSAYFKALTTTPLVEIIYGKFKQTRIKCRCSGCEHIEKRLRWFTKMEEKRTDVAIGIEMLDDAYQDNCDQFIVVSGDSDLVPPINRIKYRFPEKKITVYVPSRHQNRGAATELRNAADKNKTLPLQLVRVSQFPANLIDPATGSTIKKPSSW